MAARHWMLTVIGEFSREFLAIKVQRRMKSEAVIHVLADLFVENGQPDYLRTNNTSVFTAKAIRKWLEGCRVETLSRTRRPWKNG